MALEVRKGQAAAARQMAHGAAASLRITVLCVRAVEKMRANRETTSRKEIPRPDLRLRLEKKPFR